MVRIRVKVEQVRTLEANSGVALGPIVRHNLGIQQARQPQGSTLSAMPTNSTAKQEMSLDTHRTAEETNAPTNEDMLARKIKTQINFESSMEQS